MSLLLFLRSHGPTTAVEETVVARYVFSGRLWSIQPDPPLYGLRTVSFVARDWMAEFAEADATELDLREDAAIEDLIGDLVDRVAVAPKNISFNSGTDVYPFAFDDLGGGVPKAPQVAQDALQSDLARLYVRGDATDGETLTLETRHARAGVDPLYSFTYEELEHQADVLDIPSTLDPVLNDLEVLTVPRRSDTAATTPLVALDRPEDIGPGQTTRLFLDYQDPANEAEFVGGKNVMTPVANVDWTANTDSDGGGVDATVGVTITASPFGSRVMLENANSHPTTVYIRGAGGDDGLKVRGRGIYRYRAVSCRGQNTSSVAMYGTRQPAQPILMAYQNDRNIGQGVVDYLASVYGHAARIPQRVRIMGHTSEPDLLEQAIARDVGDPIEVPVDDEPQLVFIHGLDGELYPDGRVFLSYTLAPGDPTRFMVLDDPVLGQLDSGGVLGYA